MGQEFDRRSFLARAGVTAAGVAMAGGAAEMFGEGLAGAVNTNGPGRNGISTAKPKKGGSVIIGLNAEEQGFNPYSGRFDTAGFMYARTVFDPLFVIGASGQVVPYLAESMTPNSDYTQWNVTLRPNILFQDGTPCNGAALLQNFEAGFKSPLVGIAIDPLIDSYQQTGPLSVQINTKHPWVTLPYTLAEQQICFIAAPSMLNAPNGGTDHPIGTGPFTFKEWVPNDHFTAVANANYWRPGLPYLSQITYKPIPDDTARAQALQSGTINMMHTSYGQNVLTFRGNHSYSYVDNLGSMVGSPALNCIMLNLAQPPFNDLLARQILAYGTSGAQYSKVIENSLPAPINGLYLPNSPYYTPNLPYPKFSPSKAKKLVSQYTKKHGSTLSFSLNAVASPQTLQSAEWFQSVMKNIGVNVSIKSMQQNTLINNALFGSYQATEWSQFGGVSPDLNYPWMSTDTLHATGLSINMARNNDPVIQQSFLAGMAATTPSESKTAFAAINRRLAEDLPYIWTARSFWALVSQPKVQNWNNPVAPNGKKMLGNNQGDWWPAQMWTS
jgi:ABC-type transport system substrate-binding protein